MAKIKISADTVLAILKGIMDDDAINYKITDPTAPEEWKGKTVQEVLNVDYYTFRHRPVDTEVLVRELIEQGKDADALYALQRAFCILSLKSTERVFSKENDIATISASLEYWIQTDKVKVLEDMLEDIVIESTGIRIPVRVGSEDRQVVIAVGALSISELQETTEFGEMSVCELDIDFVFYPKATTRADYKAEFAVTDPSTKETKWVALPFSSFSFSNVMTQKAVPKANQVRSVGSINLSRARSFTFAFDGYSNEFIDQLVDSALISDIDATGQETKDIDNNKSLVLKITRNYKEYIYDCVIKEHTITVQEDIGNETHSLVLTKKGMKNGST